MISIIICSVKPELLDQVSSNINNTIGVPYELIPIDNRANQYGICKAYNTGAAQAKYPVLCFMHEDVGFETYDWGRKICQHLSDERTGLIGVAGGDAKSCVPSSWSIPIVSNEINLVQHYKTTAARETRHETNPAYDGILKKVIALDGVFLCTRKDVFQQFPFDEKRLQGFHGYDIDFSLQVNTKYNVYVAFDVLLHHYSEGTPNKQWFKSAKIISSKWKSRLPLSAHAATREQFIWHHWHTLFVLMQHLFRLKYSYPVIMGHFLRYSFTSLFSFRRFLSVGKFVFQTMIKK